MGGEPVIEPLTGWTTVQDGEFQDESEESNGQFFAEPTAEALALALQNLDSTSHVEEDEELKQALRKKRESLHSRARTEKFEELRQKISRYFPGKDLHPAGGRPANDYDVPDVTTLLLVGPMGVGKSTLINNMIRVLNQKKQGFDFAQVLSQEGENGTFLLEEYNVCAESGKIAVFDSRGLPSIDTEEGRAIIQSWMVNGVRHGQKVVRSTDSTGERESLNARSRLGHHALAVKRKVNFVILVVSALSLHQMIQRGDDMEIRNLKRLCTSPFLSMKDDRPVVVMTKGDLLSAEDRIRALIFLGKIVGVSPVDYVFDIGAYTRRTVEEEELIDKTEDMALLEMLEFALYRADRNLQYKPDVMTTIAVKVKEALSERWNKMEWKQKAAVLAIGTLWIICLLALLTCFAHSGRRSYHPHMRFSEL